MKAAPIPDGEAARVAALRRLRVLDTLPEAAFDDLTRVAARLFGVPIALVSLVDERRQWFKSHHGIEATETPRSISFCGHAVAANKMLVVSDARQDVRFADNPLVTDAPNVTFYAGTPVLSADGHPLGTMCIIDSEPRSFSEDERETLEALGRTVARQLELRVQLLERDELLRERERLAKRKDDYVAVINHELRTPVTSIRGSLTLLRNGLKSELPPKMQKLIDVAERNANRLLQMVNGLLDLERLHRIGDTLRAGELDLGQVARVAIENASGFASEHDVTIRVTIEGSIPPLAGDEPQLLRVLDNLLSNAIKYSPSGETVHVVVRFDDPRIVLQVIDRGRGVPADFRVRLFEPFEQAEGARAANPNSSGLGLSIAKKIAVLHGGDIEYADAPGGGACFSMWLPPTAVPDKSASNGPTIDSEATEDEG